MDNNLFRKVDKSTISKSTKYENIGFSRNPFPRHPGVIMNDPDNRQNGSIYLKELRSKEEKQFKDILIPNQQNSETKTIAFLMDYATRKGRGIGKTAFLNHQQKKIMTDLGYELSDGNDILFAVYVAPKPNDNYRKFHNISKLIITSIIDQDILSLAICRLRVFTGLIDDQVLSKVGNNLLQTIGNDEWLKDVYKQLRDSNKDFTKDLDIYALNQSVKRQLEVLDIDIELVNLLPRLGYSSTDINNYFTDRKPEFYWKNKASSLLFNDFVKIFELAGFTHGIILFEELEKVIVPQNSLGRIEFCQAMRYYFIDGESSYNTTSSFFKILLTIHPYLQELLYPHWNSSGLGRFAGLSEETSVDFTVYFNPIESPSAVPLAKAYLAESRKGTNKDDLHPFNEESLSLALKKALGVPGKYLAFLHSAVERAVDEGWSTIGTNEINKLSFQDAHFDDDDDDETDDSLPESHIKLK